MERWLRMLGSGVPGGLRQGMLKQMSKLLASVKQPVKAIVGSRAQDQGMSDMGGLTKTSTLSRNRRHR